MKVDGPNYTLCVPYVHIPALFIQGGGCGGREKTTGQLLQVSKGRFDTTLTGLSLHIPLRKEGKAMMNVAE